MKTVGATSGISIVFSLLLTVGIGLFAAVVLANEKYGLKVYSASTELEGGLYHLDAQLGYELSQAAIEALESGVPLTFEMEVQFIKPRKWIWSETLVSYEQQYQVSYHALTQQYIVTDLNSGVQNSYNNRKTALLTMGRINALPLPGFKRQTHPEEIKARVRISLLINSLPALMRPWAWINAEWRLSSEWFEWDLK